MLVAAGVSLILSKGLTCSEGTFLKANDTNTLCQECAAGQYSNKQNMVNCTRCPMGYFQEKVAQQLCLECPRFNFSNSSANSSGISFARNITNATTCLLPLEPLEKKCYFCVENMRDKAKKVYEKLKSAPSFLIFILMILFTIVMYGVGNHFKRDAEDKHEIYCEACPCICCHTCKGTCCEKVEADEETESIKFVDQQVVNNKKLVI
jgi:hypothetical protein